MYDWLYAIPLAILILGAGVTYFMSSSLFGPFCIVLSIAIIIIMRRRHNTVDELNPLIDEFRELAQGTATEQHNAGHCSACNSTWLLSDCDTAIEQETWELPPYTVYICRKCKTELDYFFYEEIVDHA